MTQPNDVQFVSIERCWVISFRETKARRVRSAVVLPPSQGVRAVAGFIRRQTRDKKASFFGGFFVSPAGWLGSKNTVKSAVFSGVLDRKSPLGVGEMPGLPR